jgi:hypothetical protein
MSIAARTPSNAFSLAERIVLDAQPVSKLPGTYESVRLTALSQVRLTLSTVHLFGLRFPIGPEYVTCRGIYQVGPGTQRALNPNILIALGIHGVFFLDPALHLKPMRRAFIEKSFHQRFW